VDQLEKELADVRRQAASSERALSNKLADASDESSTLRSKIAGATSDNESLRGTIESLRSELRRKEEALLRTETALTAAERDHLRTQEDLRTSLGRASGLQFAETSARDALQQKSQHIEGLRNTLALIQEQLTAKDSTIARLQADLAHSNSELLSASQKAERHERRLQDKLSVAKEKEKILSTDLEHLHRYVGKREVEVLQLADRLDEREMTLAEMSPILESTRRANKLLQLRQEREEAERLEALAKFRAKQSLKY
jgi:chromosome segregation ATPase